MISSVILITQFLCLSFWIGGSLVVLTIVGPEVFRRDSGSSVPESVMARILARFNTAFLFAALLLAATLYVQLVFLSNVLSIKLRIALSLVILAVLLGTYVRVALAPRGKRTMAGTEKRYDEPLKETQTPGKFHGRSVGVLIVNLVLGIVVVITLVLPF
ncbi:MAG: DUF4149 domain-containing protein [Ignavibacteriales bacterium]|nr:DUF4149 domain-containing protein [Ignavibacteriales bacterium]